MVACHKEDEGNAYLRIPPERGGTSHYLYVGEGRGGGGNNSNRAVEGSKAETATRVTMFHPDNKLIGSCSGVWCCCSPSCSVFFLVSPPSRIFLSPPLLPGIILCLPASYSCF